MERAAACTSSPVEGHHGTIVLVPRRRPSLVDASGISSAEASEIPHIPQVAAPQHSDQSQPDDVLAPIPVPVPVPQSLLLDVDAGAPATGVLDPDPDSDAADADAPYVRFRLRSRAYAFASVL